MYGPPIERRLTRHSANTVCSKQLFTHLIYGYFDTDTLTVTSGGSLKRNWELGR
jgi:hypothetical protein